MNIGLIIAGGKGERMQQDIPKQFAYVNDKPVIIYTLEAFERHPGIDQIGVVCRAGWEEILTAFSKQYKITKLAWIVEGGETGQASIRNGVNACAERYADDDIILVHDAVRPLVTRDIITDCIVQASRHGSAITVIPETTVMLRKRDEQSADEVVDREQLAQTQTPQAFPLGRLKWAHEEALKRGITNATASCSMFIDLGETVYFARGAETNIKLTTQEDTKMLKALLLIRQEGRDDA